MKKHVAAVLDAIEDELADWGLALSLRERPRVTAALEWGLALLLVGIFVVGLTLAIRYDAARRAVKPETCRGCGWVLER